MKLPIAKEDKLTVERLSKALDSRDWEYID